MLLFLPPHIQDSTIHSQRTSRKPAGPATYICTAIEASSIPFLGHQSSDTLTNHFATLSATKRDLYLSRA